MRIVSLTRSFLNETALTDAGNLKMRWKPVKRRIRINTVNFSIPTVSVVLIRSVLLQRCHGLPMPHQDSTRVTCAIDVTERRSYDGLVDLQKRHFRQLISIHDLAVFCHVTSVDSPANFTGI